MTPDQQQSATDVESHIGDEPMSLDFQGVITLQPAEAGAEPGVVYQFGWRGEDAEAVGDIARGETGLTITRLVISAPLPAGVTRQLLRSVPLSEVIRTAVATQSTERDLQARLTPQLKLPPGRVAVTDELLRDVAIAYLQETAPGKDRQASRRLAERYGRPEGTVRTWVARARQAGWLGPGASGRMGAEPGPKLLVWLSQAVADTPANLKAAETIARTYGVHASGIPRAAVRALQDPSEFEFPSRIGAPPLETQVVAQLLYGQSIGAELAERMQAGADEPAAFDDIAHEVRKYIAEHEQ